jgi:hypothetical protein
MTALAAADEIQPHDFSVELERRLVAQVLIDPSVVGQVGGIVGNADFTDPRAAKIFEAIIRLSRGGQEITPPAAFNELDRVGDLHSIGGPGAVAEILELEATAVGAIDAARGIRRRALKKRERGLHLRASTGERLEETREELKQVESDLAALDGGAEDLQSLGFSGDRLRETRERPQPESPLPGILDTEPSLHGIVGRPKSGKTRFSIWLAMSWAQGVAPWEGAPEFPGTRALVISAEQSLSRVDWACRSLDLFAYRGSRETWTDNLTIVARDRDLTPTERRLLRLDDSGRGLLRQVLLQAKEKGEPFGFVVLDSLSRLKPHDLEESNPDHQTQFLEPLQELAEESGAYFWLIHHQGHAERTNPVTAGRGGSSQGAVYQVALQLERDSRNPRHRILRVAGNALLDSEQTFEVASEKAEPGAINYFRPIDPMAELVDSIDDLIEVGETINNSELGRRIDGKTEGAPSGQASTKAKYLRQRWQKDGLVSVNEGGSGKATTITRIK